MFADAPAQQASAWLPTVVTGVLLFIPAIVGAVVTWWRDLGRQAARLRVLDEAKKTVEFWEGWVRTCDGLEAVSADRKLVILAELNRTAVRVSELHTQRPLGQFHRLIERSSRIRTWLFFYKAPNGRVAFRRAVFYLSAIVYPAFVIAIALKSRYQTGRMFPHPLNDFSIVILVLLMIAFYYSGVVASVNEAILKSKARELEDVLKRESGPRTS